MDSTFTSVSCSGVISDSLTLIISKQLVTRAESALSRTDQTQSELWALPAGGPAAAVAAAAAASAEAGVAAAVKAAGGAGPTAPAVV
jgi:hypothetical protein